MNAPILPPEVEDLVCQRYAAVIESCRAAGVTVQDDSGVAERIRHMLLVSDFAAEVLKRQPHLLDSEGLDRLRSAGDPGARAAQLELPADETGCMRVLRIFRDAEAMRLVFRDVNGLDELGDTLGDTGVLYESLLERALVWSETAIEARFGVARNAEGEAQRMVVLGFGKLGGSELNFSSDIDLVLGYAEAERSDGKRPLEGAEYFTRLGRQLVRLLAEPTAQGIVARVDLRLRPFGSAGRIALPFVAMEQYYQREGRDWERYAWIKARPVAGDRVEGKVLLKMLRPFVYRRYLDYTAFAGLRDMKTRIDAEVARKDLSENLKLGPGGIREIEFVVQLEQLIRGGRDPSLRVRGLLPALQACEERGYIPAERARRLRDAWRFLRHLENRVQMMRDAQTHDIPPDPVTRARIALGLGYADWNTLATELAAHRQAVTEEFNAVLVPDAGVHAAAPVGESVLWTAATEQQLDAAQLGAAGMPASMVLADALNTLPQAATVRAMSARGRARLERLMPQLIAAARATSAPELCLLRLVRLVQAVARRSSYLSLLEEQPGARRRLADLFAESAFLAESVIAQPLLLDDVLDPRMDQLPLKRAEIAAEISRALRALDVRDAEGDLERINELKASLAFRLGLAFNDGRTDAAACVRRLAALAAETVGTVLALAERELVSQHGRLPGEGSGFSVLGYGSLGGEELGFASDLDLVFVFDGERARAESDGDRVLDGVRWYQRLAQRVMHWLSVLTRAGRLYEVDARLRPDGSKSMLVTSLDAFTAYQQQRAWTWEHQALLRARPVAGDPQLGERLREVRRQVLEQPRDIAIVRDEVAVMRRRWRRERDRSSTAVLDLKQGEGALLDIEFLLQGLVLAHAAKQPALLKQTANASLIMACREAGLLDDAQSRQLAEAHAALLQRALACTLDARPRVVEREEALLRHCRNVVAVSQTLGFDFRPAADLPGTS
ncbi:bifunctional [glutamate--ammonia ligase]-adenylyl-L-tyrosine phosphorylase/[glutamate--ammonia-ligase] adenylyltransferase [Oleiagrimonas sp.]|jgi:glutamate-ammonia-ligase adenylyltransferase|uniref:bifunctional [glutamate--ammonia ligase]-adenylyl-L-tyrosine phosphorylase/[glutamate--ammonia-ligase] adenylyltransferase n=1 Tax=Oleiagrimonas sp. TaxID=2010330 RepID=UPI002626EA6C|nr:bifunctional [glutamate--ammonia ligase]-adenylyl-L-tyrosine phosphorylase/[glutamate--ammonia-ligase] adenylyltransferase [Oleiagrimonas sp.]MDA3914270.1 bifunctional [glutamate--ammonia ligase]-adenylyl-L-tyrosine phosphorylase/[glutamate--ammonia-ligase] adenylyltransferase [Oleiagrimonas sp.]